jgi:hypothetical protein
MSQVGYRLQGSSITAVVFAGIRFIQQRIEANRLKSKETLIHPSTCEVGCVVQYYPWSAGGT